jgi:hypothetical protein
VTTTTGALGTQADIVLFSLTRNNPERNVGAAGTLQDGYFQSKGEVNYSR